MFDLTGLLKLKATSEDRRVLDALAHAKRYKTSCKTIPEIGEDGRRVDVSFATQNWQKAIRDRNRPGSFVRKHFEAMVFCCLAEDLRTGDEGWKIEPEDLAEISPYLTEHIMRFGEYSTHELGIAPDAYEAHLDVDFTRLDVEDVAEAA
ncbi:hypothetical protein M2271_000672 [Streptomyces sp. LBL]|uniref:hypothetical protein n=1 Tax=Streptomyces sp. LBL TaxID=2940562 RepID=UPI0024752040|nr:hypothetical protein [Streptomyces sp. LBL]MDH6622885.1 hypothetical protein [Streptomyces sp. LBL]